MTSACKIRTIRFMTSCYLFPLLFVQIALSQVQPQELDDLTLMRTLVLHLIP